MLGGQCCFLSQDFFCPPELQVCLVWDQELVLAEMICNSCRHHPGRLQDLGWVFPISTLKGMRRAHSLFQQQCKGPRGARKSLLISVHLTHEKFLAALFKQGTELIFDSQIQRKQSNLFMSSMIFKNLDGCWISILLIPLIQLTHAFSLPTQKGKNVLNMHLLSRVLVVLPYRHLSPGKHNPFQSGLVPQEQL